MNPHDRNASKYPNPELLLVRIVGTVLFGAAMFMVGHLVAEVRIGHEFKACIEQPAKMNSYPKTKAEMKAFITTYRRNEK